MALPIGKLTILVGAGIVGSVLAKDGGMSSVSDLFSGAYKIAMRQLRRDGSTQTKSKPHNDHLLAQVNNLRQELQLLASNRSHIIINSSGSGGHTWRYGLVIVVVGYGYVWWKGWKLSDMMFASRGSLSQASAKISKQLENVFASISVVKRQLSSKIDGVDRNVKEAVELTAATSEEVNGLHGDVKKFRVDFQFVHHAVQTLETKVSSIVGKQDLTNEGVWRLCDYAWKLENSSPTENIQASLSGSTRAALGSPQVTSPSRIAALPPAAFSEQLSASSSNGSDEVQQPLKTAVSASGSKGLLHGISAAIDMPGSSDVSNMSNVSEEKKDGNFVFFRRKLSALAVLTRTRSAT